MGVTLGVVPESHTDHQIRSGTLEVTRCTHERTGYSFDGGLHRNLWVCGAPRPEGFTMSLRANVEVRMNVAEIIRSIVIGYYLLT